MGKSGPVPIGFLKTKRGGRLWKVVASCPPQWYPGAIRSRHLASTWEMQARQPTTTEAGCQPAPVAQHLCRGQLSRTGFYIPHRYSHGWPDRSMEPWRTSPTVTVQMDRGECPDTEQLGAFLLTSAFMQRIFFSFVMQRRMPQGSSSYSSVPHLSSNHTSDHPSTWFSIPIYDSILPFFLVLQVYTLPVWPIFFTLTTTMKYYVMMFRVGIIRITQ